MTHRMAFQRAAGCLKAQRFTLAVLFISVIVAGLGVFILIDLHHAQRQSRAMFERSVNDLDLIGELQYQTQEARRSMIYALTTPDANRQVEFADASRTADAQVASRIAGRGRLARSAAEVAAIARFEQSWTNYLAIRDELIGFILEGSARDAFALDQGKGVAAFNRVRDDLQAIERIIKEQAHRQTSEIQAVFKRTLIKLSVVLAVTLIFAVVTSQTVQKNKMLHVVQASEARLRVSEQRKTAIVESALDSIIAIDQQGLITEFNPSAEKTFGHVRADVLGKPMAEVIVPARLREEHRRGLAHYLATGEAHALGKRIEDTALRADGNEFPVELAITRVGAEGEPSFTAFLRDITERKQAEAELEEAHRQLLDASRHAGMAEVATEVLHNVGNVLNSVNVSVTVLTERMHRSRVGKLSQAAALLRNQGANVPVFLANDPRGQQLPEYLGQLAEHLAQEKDLALEELASLQKNIDHIKEVVARQQGYAKDSKVTEAVKVADLVDDALRLNEDAVRRHRLQVIREFDELPPIQIDKHKVLQILVNLLRNAGHACEDSGRNDRVLTVRANRGEGCVRISVIDNGVGIPAENLTRIFNHGFTTRKDGHGFGLHSGALAARQLGGSLNASSQGPGEGATFILELPLQPAENNHGHAKKDI